MDYPRHKFLLPLRQKDHVQWEGKSKVAIVFVWSLDDRERLQKLEKEVKVPPHTMNDRQLEALG